METDTIIITTNTQTLVLTGEEVHVQFSGTFPHFWLKNLGNSTVLMSLSPNIEEGKDGVIEVPAGSSAGTEQGTNNRKQNLYIIGNGKVQVMGTEAHNNPFKAARKGGGSKAYSTEEHIIGTWIDGKPLYQKTLYVTLDGTNKQIFYHNIANVDMIWYDNTATFLLDSASAISIFDIGISETQPPGLVTNYLCFIAAVSRNSFMIRQGQSSDKNAAYVTLNYTKTTD